MNATRGTWSIVDGNTDRDVALGRIAASHVKQPLLVPSRTRSHFDGWFAELSSQFDPELGAVSVEFSEESEVGAEVVVYDQHGRILHRRVTKRKK